MQTVYVCMHIIKGSNCTLLIAAWKCNPTESVLIYTNMLIYDGSIMIGDIHIGVQLLMYSQITGYFFFLFIGSLNETSLISQGSKSPVTCDKANKLAPIGYIARLSLLLINTAYNLRWDDLSLYLKKGGRKGKGGMIIRNLMDDILFALLLLPETLAFGSLRPL
ncbi:hypothetical protein ACJX0J_037759 [Zea mays]